MRSNWFAAMGMGALVLSALAFGAENYSEGTSSDSVAASALSESVESPGVTAFGSLEIRPTYYPKGDNQDGAGLENTVTAGVQLNPNVSLSYVQAFDANIVRSQETRDSDIVADDGYFKANFANLWVSSDETLSFSYQPRVYIPTDAVNRDRGMVTYVRNYLTLSKKFSDSFNFATSLIPIFHFYSRSGNGAQKNPGFETRLYLIPTYNFTAKLSLSVPLMVHFNRSRTHQGSANSSWVFWTWPELLYSIDNTNTVGVAYYSGNFLKGLGSQTQTAFSDGFANGAFQLMYRASL